MLILTRRVGETIIIGDDISITVLEIKGNQARIGIDAPLTTSVHREEVYRRIQQESGAAEGEPPCDMQKKPSAPLVTVRQRSRLWNIGQPAFD